MSEEIKQKPAKEKGRKLYTLGKILFCAIAFLLVILTVLANMGGNSQFHKDSVEQFASETTGLKAKIGMLVNMTYFPTISVDFEDMDLLKGESEIPSAHIDKTQAAFGFWDVAMRTGKVKVLNIQGIHLSAGALLDKAVSLKYLSILDVSDTTAKLEGQGFIGAAPLTFTMDMTASGEGSGRKYSFEPRRAASAELGDIKISGMLQNGSNPYLSIQDLKITKGGKNIFSGRIDISKRRTREITISGEIKCEENGTILKPDLIFDIAAHKMSGPVTSDNFKAADFSRGSAIYAFTEQLIGYLGDPAKDAKLLDEFFAAQDVTLDVKGDIVYQGKLKFENNALLLK